MAIYKNDNGTWYVMIRYQDWTGARKQKCKRGFSTRKEAADWELQFKLQKKASVDMTMESFCTMYEEDVREQVETLVKQMAEKQGVNENLKRQDQMRWVRLMNNIKVSAEEIVLKEIIYV